MQTTSPKRCIQADLEVVRFLVPSAISYFITYPSVSTITNQINQKMQDANMHKMWSKFCIHVDPKLFGAYLLFSKHSHLSLATNNCNQPETVKLSDYYLKDMYGLLVFIMTIKRQIKQQADFYFMLIDSLLILMHTINYYSYWPVKDVWVVSLFTMPQTSMRICTSSPEPLMLAYTKYWCR